MDGRITKLIDHQQGGIITSDDGVEYAFRDSALIGTTFNSLQIGGKVVFSPLEGRQHIAATVRLPPRQR
jgi:cold shock CspA family protein